MGIFNRLSGKLGDSIGGLGDRLGGVARERTVVLDVSTIDKWPDQLVRHTRLDDALDSFAKDVERKRQKAHEAKVRLADPRLKERKFPERAHPIYDEHLPLLLREADAAIKAADFGRDPFIVEERQAAFCEAMASYHESTRKSVTALKEFLADELVLLNQAVRELEDASLAISPKLEQARFANVKELRRLIADYKGTREKEAKLKALRSALSDEIGSLDAKKIRIKERIRQIAERSRDGRYRELIAEEEQLHEQEEALRAKGLAPEELASALKPVEQRLAYIRKQMISDVTALNINEQRGFLDGVKDDLSLAQRKIARVDELLADLRFETYRQKFSSLVEPYKARIEDATQIIEEDEHVVPQ